MIVRFEDRVVISLLYVFGDEPVLCEICNKDFQRDLRLLKTITSHESVRTSIVSVGSIPQLVDALPNLNAECLESALVILDVLSTLPEGRPLFYFRPHGEPRRLVHLEHGGVRVLARGRRVLGCLRRLSSNAKQSAIKETEAEATTLLVVVEPNAEKRRYPEEQRSSHSLQFNTAKRRLLQMAAPPTNMLGLSSQNHWFHGSGSASSSSLPPVMKEEDDGKISSMFYEAELVISTTASVQSSQDTNQRGIVVSSRLGLLEVVSFISEVVISIRSTNNGTSQEIRVAAFPTVPGGIPSSAANKCRINLNGHNGGASVVNLSRVVVPIAHHVASGSRVVSKNVVHLIKLKERYIQKHSTIHKTS
nr:U-box domain-containing protein 30-like [Ipomoea batatas]